MPRSPAHSQSSESLDEARYQFAKEGEYIDDQDNNVNQAFAPNKQIPPVAEADVNPNQAGNGILFEISRRLREISNKQSREAH